MNATWQWITAHWEVLFSGVGGIVITGIAGALIRAGWKRWRESRAAFAAGEQQQLSHARVARRSLQNRLPRTVLRLLYKPEDLQRQVVIALRDNAPGSLRLGDHLPSVDLYFQITNLSPIDLVLDRALVDVWFGQPTFTALLLHRYSVPAGQITKGIHIQKMLADNQKTYIEAFNVANHGTKGRFYVYITAYFESKLGRFSVFTSIERDRL